MDINDGKLGTFPNPYNPLAWITGNPIIGDGTWIGAFCLIDGQGGLTIGKGCNISCGVSILTHSTARRCITARAYPTNDTLPTELGDYVFVGEHATVLKGSTIGDRCIIGAGAVVLENSVIPSECVVVGVPALVIRRLSPASLKRGELKECDCVVLDSSDLRESVIAKPCKEHF